MFYSQFILAKKGPLGTIWIAAHLERKLRKNQVADTDIGVSVDSILSPDVPIALRLSSHLLLGVVRIYNRKVNYLFDDCSDALLKIKQAFRSAAVDLPPEESKAPYHSITLPETFDLDDFELPDNDIFLGNFVDHHISSREQITLQDTMEGVSYSTSKFGLDERFGDGDASGLDLDEELFLNKMGTTEHADERSAPQTSVGSMTPLKEEEHPETSAVNSETKVDDANNHADLMDYAQAPSTPGLLEEPNLSNVKEVSACEDHLELDCHAMEVTESAKNTTEDKQEISWHSRDNIDSDVLTEDHQSGGLNIDLSKPQGECPIEADTGPIPMNESSPASKPTTNLLCQVETQNPSLELADKIIDTTEDLQNGVTNKDDNSSLPVDKPSDDHQGCEVGLERIGCEIPDLTSTSHQVSEVVSVENQWSMEVEIPGNVELAIDPQLCPDASDLASKKQDGSFLQDPEIPPFHEPIDSSSLNFDVPEKVASTETFVLRPCNSNVEQHDLISVISTDADVKSDGAALATSGRETTVMLDNSEEILKINDIQDHTSQEDVQAASIQPENEELNTNLHDGLVENLNNSAEAELPAPEKLLSVVEGHADQHKDMLVDGTPGVFAGFDEGDAGSKIVSGKKRSFTESTLTEQSLNSVESSRLVRFKRTVESVPDDDDLLSSILVGRSSVLKVKPTPRLSEVTSMKRTRSAPRTGGPKRKVLMDDTMVLHGDTIRLQLTSTEDIRRVRKKAPCTLPEISIIQKQYLEDEIFLQPAFTGMSPEFRSLHSQMCDLSRIIVCKSDPVDASLDTVAELKLPSETVPPENDENVVSLETMDEKVLASHDVKDEDSLAVADEPHLTSQNAENDESLDIENLNASGRPNATEQSGVQITSEPLLDGDIEVAEPRENPNWMEEADVMNAEINATKETDLSQEDLLLDVTGVGTSSKNEDAVNSPLTAEVESLYSIKEVLGDASADIAQKVSITETSETNPFVNADVSYDQKTDAPYVEFDSTMMYSDNVQAEYEHTDKDGDITAEAETEPVVRDGVVSGVMGDGANVELLSNSKDRELEYNENTELESAMYEDSFLNNDHDQNPQQPEAYERYVLDGENSGFDLHNQEELEYAAAAHDTDFLNVDDDEQDEIADDHIPDDDEERFTETTGWSSRTRAVSKYLQTLFVKEAERGRSYLSMDNLLIGKSRKEASRMFFETLVLKTRDHIHVEQPTPFDDIAIKPRTRLTKYDF